MLAKNRDLTKYGLYAHGPEMDAATMSLMSHDGTPETERLLIVHEGALDSAQIQEHLRESIFREQVDPALKLLEHKIDFIRETGDPVYATKRGRLCTPTAEEKVTLQAVFDIAKNEQFPAKLVINAERIAEANSTELGQVRRCLATLASKGFLVQNWPDSTSFRMAPDSLLFLHVHESGCSRSAG